MYMYIQLTFKDTEYSYEFDGHQSSKYVCQDIESSNSQGQIEKPEDSEQHLHTHTNAYYCIAVNFHELEKIILQIAN